MRKHSLSGVKIVSKKKLPNTMKVFDFEVEDAHHYILESGIISHNSYFPTKEMCLTKGNKIIMSDGNLEEIQNVKEGDFVKTLDGQQKVTKTYHISPSEELYRITFEDGTSVTCSKRHKFLMDGIWIEVEDLFSIMEKGINVDVMALKIMPTISTIIDIKKVPAEETYDIEVENSHHYILENGVISHNSGGGGLKYAASGIVYLAKSKERDEQTKEVVGNIIKVMIAKSRFTKEQKRIETLLRFDGGLDRYYGLLPIAEKYGIFKKKPRGYEMPDGTTAFEKNIINEPKKYYTPAVMALLEDACKKEFLFHGTTSGDDDIAPEILDGADDEETVTTTGEE